MFLTFLFRNTSSEQFGTLPPAKIFLYLDILTLLPTLNLGTYLLFSLFQSQYWCITLHEQASF